MSFWWTDPLDQDTSVYQRSHCDETVQIPSNAAQRPCQAVPCLCSTARKTAKWLEECTEHHTEIWQRSRIWGVSPLMWCQTVCLSAVNPTFAGSTRTCSTLQFDTHTLVSFFHFLFVLVVCRQRDVSFLNYLCIFHTVTNVHYTNVFYELTLHVNHQHLFSSS